MTPSQTRDIAIGNARFLTERASIHIEHGRYSRAGDCLRSATGWLEVAQPQSSADTLPATIPAAPDTSVADRAAGNPIHPNTERLA